VRSLTFLIGPYLARHRVDAVFNHGGDRLSLMVFAIHDGEVQINERIDHAEKGGEIDRMTEQRRRLDISFSHLQVNHHRFEVVGPFHVERTTQRNAAPGTRVRHV